MRTDMLNKPTKQEVKPNGKADVETDETHPQMLRLYQKHIDWLNKMSEETDLGLSAIGRMIFDLFMAEEGSKLTAQLKAMASEVEAAEIDAKIKELEARRDALKGARNS